MLTFLAICEYWLVSIVPRKTPVSETALILYRSSTQSAAYSFLAGSTIADFSENYEARADYQIAFFFYSVAPLLFFLALAAAILFIVRKIVSTKSRKE